MSNFNHHLPTPRLRNTLAGLVLILIAGLIIGALTIPFQFESSTMFYKFGVDKAMLRGGKMIGLAAAILLMVQLPLAGRIKFLDRLFSLPALYRVHRLNAFVICPLVLLHVVCVMAPDDLYMIPLEGRYWPEWLGALLLVLILCQTMASRWRSLLGLPYHRWMAVHRVVGAATMVLLLVHVLYVSETFSRSGLPRYALGILAGSWLVLWIGRRLKPYLARRHPYTVSKITPTTGNKALIIDLIPEGGTGLAYAPGQFVFVSFRTPHLTREAHPFTLSSTPTKSGELQITIRPCGDWTDRVQGLDSGAKAYIQGPFGRFSHLASPDDRELVMIAGGIGITPMLSMLRYIADVDDQRKITLIWSNRSQPFLFAKHELSGMQQVIQQFQWFPVFTREKADFGYHGRLGRNMLQDLIGELSNHTSIFICGPPVMIRDVRTTLRQLGFAREAIKSELFGF
jgi:predicted ferric reductase